MRLLESEFKVAELRVFQRYAVDGEGARETAAALGLTVNQVYQAKSRITKRYLGTTCPRRATFPPPTPESCIGASLQPNPPASRILPGVNQEWKMGVIP